MRPSRDAVRVGSAVRQLEVREVERAALPVLADGDVVPDVRADTQTPRVAARAARSAEIVEELGRPVTVHPCRRERAATGAPDELDHAILV